MFEVLAVTLPVFAVIAVGYGVVRFGPFSRDTMRALGDFTMTVTLPCALFTAVAGRDFGEVVNLSYLVTLALAGVATQLVMFAAARLQGAGPKRRALSVLAAATPNTAFLGYPIFLIVIPEHAAPVVAMNLLIENIVLTPIGLTLLGGAREDGAERVPPLRLAGQIVLSVLKRPLIIGLLLGFGVVLTGVESPAVLERFTGLLGQAAAPVALAVIGGSLFGLNLQGDLTLAGLIAFVKMIVHPAAVVVMYGVLASAGWVALPDPLRIGLILTACMPMFAIFVLFGQEAGHEGLASLALLIGTCLSFVTVNVALLLLI
ncbi:auxin efflux carrier family protein [Pseudooceanicola batsensis HTCC2597]|uniref:Auxin efflux carrier family protein n=1 Tax=Pseudooceanicola batsensis (strain ATCC BAA-863 / DSM 15984 / KCTC 12145 / HTCC2597) TaxID=252305 RepID=A3U3Y4_PSEBH|nr:AEC family transporter [Pseudooceanicola batsensis]EAQ01120.1 auxin efflux carrier family protein [Pseudooceanicola batsensis HTCC2597]